MLTTRFASRLLIAAALAIAVFPPNTILAQPSGGACSLVTAAEMESLLGGPIALAPGTLGDVQTCSGQAATARALVRLFKRTGGASGDNEKAGIEAVKKMGVQVDVATANGITCLTMVPPANMAQMGFGTTCTVTSKAPTLAVIEITAKTQKDMIPLARLRVLAEKMATRF